MYFREFIELYTTKGFDFKEAKSEIDFVLSALFDYTYRDFLLNKNLEHSQLAIAQRIFKERTSTRCPIQQLVGIAFFYDRKFFVDKYTLIPRPETELLVNEVLKFSKNIISPDILDIGTGSGCIGLTLCIENPQIRSTLVDIQENALKIAKKNTDYYNLSERVKLIKSDLFENITEKFDIIVSNPPYIPLKEKTNLQIEVRDFEPKIALFANDEYGVEFYEKIISLSRNFLKPDGIIAFELGINQCEKVKQMLIANKFEAIRIIKDFNGINRIISACKIN